MKIEGRLFALLAVFLIVVTFVYWYYSHEAAGTSALAVSFGLAFLIAYYALFTSRRIDPRPEDDPAADIADGAGEIGFFSPYSWWPLPVGVGAGLFTLGVVLGWWLSAFGAGLLAIAVCGFVFEYSHRW